MRKILSILAATVAALALFTAAATAATIDDVRALGYTVGLANVINGCNNWQIQGFGVNTEAYECSADYQQTIGSLIDPVNFTESRWQFEHPEGQAARWTLSRNGYSVTRSCGTCDTFVVAGGLVNTTVDTAGLVSLAGSLPSLGTIVAPTMPTANGDGTSTLPPPPQPVASSPAATTPTSTSEPAPTVAGTLVGADTTSSVAAATATTASAEIHVAEAAPLVLWPNIHPDAIPGGRGGY